MCVLSSSGMFEAKRLDSVLQAESMPCKVKKSQDLPRVEGRSGWVQLESHMVEERMPVAS